MSNVVFHPQFLCSQQQADGVLKPLLNFTKIFFSNNMTDKLLVFPDYIDCAG